MTGEFELAIVSDVHIKTKKDKKIQEFISLLHWLESRGCKALLLNGDIFDFFFPSRFFLKQYKEFFDALEKFAKDRDVYFVQGNHEFFLNKAAWRSIQPVSKDSIILSTQQGSIYCAHGDHLHPSKSYHLLRKVLRSSALYQIIRWVPGWLLDQICLQVSSLSRHRNKDREARLPHLQILKIANQSAQEVQCNTAVLGHYHTPWAQSAGHTPATIYGLECWDNPNVLLFGEQVWRAHLESSTNWVMSKPKPYLFDNATCTS